MSKGRQVMKIFEVAWLFIAAISLLLALRPWLMGSKDHSAFLYLLLIFVLAILMFFIKRGSRKAMEKRDAEATVKNKGSQL